MAEPTWWVSRRAGALAWAEDHEWGLGIFACRLTGDPPLASHLSENMILYNEVKFCRTEVQLGPRPARL